MPEDKQHKEWIKSLRREVYRSYRYFARKGVPPSTAAILALASELKQDLTPLLAMYDVAEGTVRIAETQDEAAEIRAVSGARKVNQ